MTTYGSKPKRLLLRGRRSQVYYVRVYQGSRRSWKSTRQRRLDAAKAVLTRWRTEAATGQVVTEDLPFSTAIDRWLQEKTEQGVSRNCLTVWKSYGRSLKQHFGDIPLRDVDRDALKAYLAKRKRGRARKDGTRQELSDVSVGNELRMIRQFLLFAVNLGWTSRNPAKLIRVKSERQSIRFLEPDQEERFLKEARRIGEDLYARCFAMLRSGLRGGTLSQLLWDQHIDWQRQEWTIPSDLMKARRDFNAPIAGDLMAYLREHRKRTGKVFCKLDRRQFQQAATNAGVPWLKAHHLRKTFCTRLGRCGVPLEVTAELSHHHDLGVLMRLYRAIGVDEKKAALQKAFGPKGGKAARRKS